MMERFLVVLGQVATLFLLMGAGFILEKRGRLSQVGTGQMSTLLLNVVTPCLIIRSFPTDWDQETLRALGVAAAATAGVYVLYALFSRILFRREGEERGIPLRFGCIYGNVGFMGFPLVEAVLGQEALVYTAIVVAVFNISAFTYGGVMMGGREALSPKKLLLNPGVVGVAVGLPLFLGRVVLPTPVANALGHMSNLNTPLAMLIIGAQMARADLAPILKNLKFYAAAAVKLLLLPLLTAVALLPLRGNGSFYAASVILAATPTAGFTSIFAERFHRSPELAAQLVSFSTAASILTLPLMAVLAETLIG